MNAKYIFFVSRNIWLVLLFLTTAIAVIVWPEAVEYPSVPLLVNWYSVTNTMGILALFLFLHYLVLTNQASFEAFSDFAAVYGYWTILMVVLAVDPAWWITRVIGGGILFLGIESFFPNWLYSVKEWLKKMFFKGKEWLSKIFQANGY